MRDNSALEALVQALRRLPGVGQRSASRMAYHLLQHDPEGAQLLARTLVNAVEAVKHCQRCHTLTEFEICATCQDSQRDATRLCVVETPADQSALERTLAYQGLYFVLMGKLSPIEGVGPNDIGMQKLIQRVDDGLVQEVILATNFTAEGEATAQRLGGDTLGTWGAGWQRIGICRFRHDCPCFDGQAQHLRFSPTGVYLMR